MFLQLDKRVKIELFDLQSGRVSQFLFQTDLLSLNSVCLFMKTVAIRTNFNCYQPYYWYKAKIISFKNWFVQDLFSNITQIKKCLKHFKICITNIIYDSYFVDKNRWVINCKWKNIYFSHCNESVWLLLIRLNRILQLLFRLSIFISIF